MTLIVLRKEGIKLQKWRSWFISADPEFAHKFADIAGLNLDPPESGIVVFMDEKPAIQTSEQAKGCLKLPIGKALTGVNHEYRKHGTGAFFAALNVPTGQVKAEYYGYRRREFLDFMDKIVPEQPAKFSGINMPRKPKRDHLIKRHPKFHLHFTPKGAC